jgi:hypothetical protein
MVFVLRFGVMLIFTYEIPESKEVI